MVSVSECNGEQPAKIDISNFLFYDSAAFSATEPTPNKKNKKTTKNERSKVDADYCFRTLQSTVGEPSTVSEQEQTCESGKKNHMLCFVKKKHK